ncbi:class I SAM-dependent methyltransferase [Paenibacillus sp. S150]|uniref:class I SAM-dependent methyltransferase n=1 Tax=Paenibacillus sp. S150 TaxID=2749826 RepID=UPI001C5969CB|nr:class I SAM-dependent methyltransferase [Paenibacillus sp. S150]MBW4085729.1 class I SAM-dependent methyltransferase [Paenibacillus sp. S150]
MGCGTGIIAGYLAQLGYEVIAVEFAESRAELARQRLSPFPHAAVRLGDAANPPIAPGEVDAVVSRNLLWLLPDPRAAVIRWAKLTGSNGRIAAIDSLRRIDHRKRSRRINTIRQLHGRYRRAKAHSAELSHVAAAPLPNIAHPQQAVDTWLQAGLANVRTENLAWITAVKHYYESPVSRALALSQYYAVLGDC